MKPITNGITIAFCLAVNFYPVSSIAYDNKTVHRSINSHAIDQSILVTTNRLPDLGFDKKLDTVLIGPGGVKMNISKWIEQGGFEEDEPKTRSLDHFHDPLQPWNDAGLWDSKLRIFRNASVEWAQRSDNNYSWTQARNHFYQALTTGSETEFATTFRTLGQVMHLVSDMSVPAHVRDDAHLIGDPYETWTSDSKNFDALVFTATEVSKTIFSQAITTGEAPAPITALWDHDVYNGTNPAVTLATAPAASGLAEFTNANFFSKDTFSGYNYPATDYNTLLNVDWLYPEEVLAEDGQLDTRVYYWGDVGSSNIRKAGASLITLDVMNKGHNPPWIIDDNVNRDYASLLIPAAVGYSTALLDYFFRGDIDLKVNPSVGGYLLFNNSDQAMTGDFAVYYNRTDGTRRKIDGAEWLNTTVAANSRLPVVGFTIPQDHADPAKYVLVFQGQMGAENGAVAGRVVTLKPFGLLSIAITGNLYDAKGYPSGDTGPTVYLVWDVGHNAPLALPKAGGGYWSYPLGAEDYSGEYLGNLKSLFGEDIEINAALPLFSSNGPATNDISPDYSTGYYVHSPIPMLYWGQRVGYCGHIDCSDELWDNMEIYENQAGRDCGPGMPPFSEFSAAGVDDVNRIVTSNYEGDGVYSNTGSSSQANYDSRQTYFVPSEEEGIQGICVVLNDSATNGATYSGHDSMQFFLPVGGTSNDIAWGVKINDITQGFGPSGSKTQAPNPAVGMGILLSCTNKNLAATKAVGPRIEYSRSIDGLFSSSTTFNHGYLSYEASGETLSTGTGSFTTIDGTVFSISHRFSESGTITKEHGDIGSFVGFNSYSGSRSINFCADYLHVSSSFDPDDNLIAFIAVQSVESGQASADLAAMVAPFSVYSTGSEGVVDYTDLSNSYHIRTICAAVDDATTQNPWELPDNSGLTEKLQGTISQYLALNPPSGNNHWNISTSIHKIQ